MTTMFRTNSPMFLFSILALFISNGATSQTIPLDDFETLQGWKSVVSEGAKLDIIGGEGESGSALVMDFDLRGTSGYTIAQKDFPLDLPANYQFTFDMRAEAPVNNFEFKLLDSLGNVWWIKKLNVEYPKQWIKQRIKKRHLTYAWGPSGGGDIRRVTSIEFVVSSGTGGKGKVFIDNFRFERIDDEAAKNARAIFHASSIKKNSLPILDEKGNVLTNWASAGNQTEWLSIDFKHPKEFGGLVIIWDSSRYATTYDVQLSDDGKTWTTVYSVTNGNGGRDYVYLPEQEGHILKLSFNKSNGGEGYSIARLEVKGSEFGASANNFFTTIAGEQPTGLFPKYFLRKQSYWTVMGSSGDTKEALINEQGAIEVDQLSFSLEPFLFVDGKLITWNDVSFKQSLEKNYLPIPSVKWKYGGIELTVRAFSAGVAGKSLLIATYTIENKGGSSPKGKLFIALRPFQVNPPWQWLNKVGGASRIDSIRYEHGLLHVQDKDVIPISAPSAFGATNFDSGDILDYLQTGRLPWTQNALDSRGFASGALQYDYDVPSGVSKEFHIVVPFHEWSGSPTPNMSDGADIYVNLAHSATVQFWESKLDRFQVKLPPSAQPVINTVKSNLAYIFINRDGPGIQPGSRSYERSWIRDGSLTSTAMLQLGVNDEVRDYIDWYAKYQFPNGKIPCVVDTRGGDPTNEHDSHGEFIYAIMQYFNYTHDTTWLRGKWGNVVKTVRYIQSLRAERKTDLYKNNTPEQRACYGLVPESISHEGYSAKPMHSYWDDFFILRGLKDATTIAGILNEQKLKKEFAQERDDFKKDLYGSMRSAMKNKNIDYIPGCVELGDFDATSTTIGVDPCSELGNIPEPQLHNTFDRYYEYFTKRKNNTIEWKAYTPYENRVIGTFVFLDQKQRAHDAMDFFMKDRRPAGWNHWAEVVYRDPETSKYIGDMPHTWVGSDFIRSVRAMFVYEREQDNALVIGAGIADEWLDDPNGISVSNLRTYYGMLNYTMKKKGNSVTVTVDGDMNIPSGKIVLKSPIEKSIVSVRMNGKKAGVGKKKEIIIGALPAKVEISY